MWIPHTSGVLKAMIVESSSWRLILVFFSLLPSCKGMFSFPASFLQIYTWTPVKLPALVSPRVTLFGFKFLWFTLRSLWLAFTCRGVIWGELGRDKSLIQVHGNARLPYVCTWKSHGNMYLERGEFDGVCCCLSWSGLLQFRLCVFLTEGLLKAETFQLFDGIPSSSVFASRSISSTSSSVSSSSSFSLSLSMSSACSMRESFSRGFSTGGGRGLGGGGGGLGGAGASWSAGHLL